MKVFAERISDRVRVERDRPPTGGRVCSVCGSFAAFRLRDVGGEENWLVPIDARLRQKQDSRSEAAFAGSRLSSASRRARPARRYGEGW